MKANPNQENGEMQKEEFRSERTSGFPRGLMAGALLAVGGLAVSLAAAATAGATTNVVVAKAKNPTFGTILISGKTVYTLKPSKTPCSTQCLKFWPELLLPKGETHVKVGKGVNAARIGTVKRKGGRRQVTYSGKPLYFFFQDKSPGQVKGNVTDEWGKWSVVVTAKPTGTSTSSTSSSGSGGSTAGTGGVSF
jgi:predicted lipoprotein with Yx(FWY)xxD motif